jgi:hypothetical protein
MRDVFYGELILGVLGYTWEDNIRMNLIWNRAGG